MDERQNKAEAQPAWLQLAAGAAERGLAELGKKKFVHLNGKTAVQLRRPSMKLMLRFDILVLD